MGLPLKYLNIFNTLYQSSYVGLSDFLEALLTENSISGLVLIAKYNRDPIACLYLVTLNFLLLKLVDSIGIVFNVGLYLFMSNLFKINHLNISFDGLCNHLYILQILYI